MLMSFCHNGISMEHLWPERPSFSRSIHRIQAGEIPLIFYEILMAVIPSTIHGKIMEIFFCQKLVGQHVMHIQ